MSEMATVDPELVDMMTNVFATHRARRDRNDRHPDARTFDAQLWQKLHELGLTRLTAAETDGGSGATWRESAALLGAAAANAVQLPLMEHDLLAGWLLEQAGLPVDDRLRTACILDETGTARAVPWAQDAEQVVLLWRLGDAWAVADVAVDDLSINPALSFAGEPRDDVSFDLAALDGTPVGSDVAETFFLRGALARTLQVCGALEKILELTVTHSTDRVQFGRALAKFQAVQNLVADMAMEASLARAAAAAAVTEVVQHGWNQARVAFSVAVAKSCAGHAAALIVRNAHQVHGAIGTTREHELHEYTKPVLIWRSEFGSLHYWDNLIAQAAIKGGRKDAWTLVQEGGPLPFTRR